MYSNEAVVLYDDGVRLVDGGDVALAMPKLERAAALGYGAALIELARIERSAGRPEREEFWRKKAEASALQGDSAACTAVYLYYRRYGLREDFVNADFLKKAAELGVSEAQIWLAQQFLRGIRGRGKSEAEYEKWIWKAIDSGNDGAVLTHATNRMDQGRSLEDRALVELRRISGTDPDAKELLMHFEKM